ncbi:hypothetical protein ACWGCW_00475 [Streptomyces sp. NPDC054933]
MTTATAALAEALTDLPDAPPEVRQLVGAELLYALGLAERPSHLDDELNPVEAGMTLRTAPLVNHLAVAAGLKELPGLWLTVGLYPTRDAALDVARKIRSGRILAYAPTGSYDATFEYRRDGVALLVTCLGERPAKVAA